MAYIRTFIAVQATERVNNNVLRVIQRLAATQADFRWVEPENLHVTLNFAGDIVDTEIPEFCRLIKQSVEKFPPFEMSLQGVGGFPDATQPRTLWMGVDQGAETLQAMYKQIEVILLHWGVNKDRNEYFPHLTMGRVQRSGRWNEDLLALVHRLRSHDSGVCQVDKVIVYSSFLDRSGPTHTPMATIRLKG